MITVQQVKDIIELKLAESDNFIVDVKVNPGNKIIVLLDNDNGVSIDECVKMSRHIEFSLDREAEDFELNVMSPGLTEPFKILRQYQKNIDRQVEVTTTENKKIIGKLISADEQRIVVETRTTERLEGKKGKQLIIKNINLKFSEIKSTKLILLF